MQKLRRIREKVCKSEGEKKSEKTMAARDESEELEELEDDSRWSDWEGSDEDEGNDSQRAGIWFLPLCVPSTSKTNETCYVKTAKDALEYDTKQRGFDIAKVVKELKLGFYDCIK